MSEPVPTASLASKKKKRRGSKRPRVSPEEQLQQEQQERYDKLVYACRKALHKDAKVVKTFECQKIVRKLKQDASSQSDASTTTKHGSRLERTKTFSIDVLVQVCLQRLGLPTMNPNSSEDDSSSRLQVDALPLHDKTLLERMLQHKRMKRAIDTWGDKVADYRRWLLGRQEYLVEGPKPRMAKQRKDSNTNRRTREDSTEGRFVQLGGHGDGESGDENSDDTEHKNAEATSDQKKNRPGQRARRAKAMAIQARKEGGVIDSSLNWREAKTSRPAEMDKRVTGAKAKQAVDPSKIAAMGTTWKEEGKKHPSWAARQSQKTGIVAFAGQKTTFN